MVKYIKVRRILVGVCVFMLLGCSESRKITKAVLILDEHPEVAARYCGNKFPMKDTVIYRDSTRYDTIWQINPTEIDTVLREDTVVVTITKTSPAIIKTIVEYKEVIKQPTEKIEEQRSLYLGCEGRYRGLFAKYENTDAERKQWKERFWWILIVAAALAGYIVRKPVMRLVSKLPIK